MWSDLNPTIEFLIDLIVAYAAGGVTGFILGIFLNIIGVL